MTAILITPIHTDADHEAALSEIEQLWNAEPGTLDSDRLDILFTLVEAYDGVKRYSTAA